MALRRALTNLVHNAVEHAGGTVRVRVTARDAGFTVESANMAPTVQWGRAWGARRAPSRAATCSTSVARAVHAASAAITAGVTSSIADTVARVTTAATAGVAAIHRAPRLTTRPPRRRGSSG